MSWAHDATDKVTSLELFFLAGHSMEKSKQGNLPKHVVLGDVPKGFWNSHTVVFDIQGIEIDRFLMNILVTFFVDVLQTKFDCFTDKLAWAYSAMSSVKLSFGFHSTRFL